MKKTNKISRPGRGSADPKKGAVLLIAILVSGVALAVGFGVYNRTYKELLFASFWKQSQIAFAAADAGLECAMYWDMKQLNPPSCFGALISGWDPTANLPSANFTADVSGGCVKIEVTKVGVAPVVTTIRARGYNSACGSTNPRQVERGLGVGY